MRREKPGVPLPHTRSIVAWNIPKPKQVWAICLHLRRETRLRHLVVFDLAVDSKLRSGDLVRPQNGELVANATVRHRATIVQQKAGQAVQFKLSEGVRKNLLACFIHRGGALDDYVVPGWARGNGQPSTRQYACRAGEWVGAAGRARAIQGTHSLRRTKVTLIYKRAGDLRAVQIQRHHTKLESTVRCFGDDAEDALTLPDATELTLLPCSDVPGRGRWTRTTHMSGS